MNRTGNRVIAVFMALIVAICTIKVPDAVQAATVKPKSIIVDNCSTGKLTVIKGRSYKLKTTVNPTNAKNKQLIFTSSKKKVATVNAKGLIKAKKTGKTVITIKSKANKKIVKKIKLTIVKKSKFKKIKSIKYTGGKSVNVGKTLKLNVKITPANASNKNLTWRSSNTKVATVDFKGVVTGKKEGRAVIKAASNDGSKKKLQITINVKKTSTKPVKKLVKKISVSASDNKVSLGRSLDLKVSVSPVDADNKEVTYISSDTKIAEVDQSGKVTPVSVGLVTITVKATDGSGCKDEIVLKVTPEVTDDNIPVAVAGGEGEEEKDSDGDNLTDYEEYTYTNTDPSLKDTNGNGIRDDKDDEDGDKLSNKEELRLNTNPISADSDNDVLSDYDETKTYNTSPLNSDTDEDEVSDYDEIQLGLNPLNPMSDGTTPDAERIFNKSLFEDQINDELLSSDNLMKPNLLLEGGTSKVLNTVTLKQSVSYDLPDQRYIIGKAIDLEKNDVDFNGSIQFQYDSSIFTEKELGKFVICTVSDGDFIPLDTTIDTGNHRLTADINTDGTYFVLNVETFLSSLGFSESVLLGVTVEADTSASFTNLPLNAEKQEATLENKQIDYYSLTPETSGLYYIYAESDAGDMNTILYDEDGTVLDKSNVGNTNYAYNMTAGKTYYLAVAFRYVTTSGSYTVGWEQSTYDENGVPQRYKELTGEDTLTADIRSAGDTAFYRFVPQETAYYDFYSSAESDTYGILLDEFGETIETDDDSGENGNFRLRILLSEGTVYYLGARFFDSEAIGSIPLSFEKYIYEPEVSFSLNETSDWDAIPVSLASKQQSVISYIPEESGYYTITSSGYSDTIAILYDAMGMELSSDDDGGDESNFSLTYYLEAGNLYYYVVREYYSDAAEFTVTFANNNSDELIDEDSLLGKSSLQNSSPKRKRAVSAPSLDNLIEEDVNDSKSISNTEDVQERNKPDEGKTEIPESEAFTRNVPMRAMASPAYQGQADIVFAIDTTGSMSDAITGVAQNVNLFVTKLAEEYNVQANFALVDFKDIEEDGLNSTVVIKNGSSNWFDDVSVFKNKVNALDADGGGDTPESDIDALETSRNLGFREGAEKFIILITDADFKVANRYGISTMDEEINRLVKDNIHVSVVSTSYDRECYQNLYTKTGGIWTDIYGDFSTELLSIANTIGQDTSDGVWVLLRGNKYVKLKGDIEENLDTDGDSLTDKEELGRLKTTNVDALVLQYLKSLGVTNEYVTYDGKIKYYDYTSNPVLKDSDGDGINDKEDTAKLKKGLAGGVLGELTIVSCHPDEAGFTGGHAWLSYNSYVNDTLDFSKLLTGYVYDYDRNTFNECNPGKYSINAGGNVSIGDFSTGDMSGTLSTIQGSCGGILFNEEFSAQFRNNDHYTGIAAYTREITEEKLSKVISYCNDNSYYNVYSHNCSSVASEGWEKAFGTSDGMKAKKTGITNGVYSLFDTPATLKENILKKEDADKDYRNTMLTILKNWR